MDKQVESHVPQGPVPEVKKLGVSAALRIVFNFSYLCSLPFVLTFIISYHLVFSFCFLHMRFQDVAQAGLKFLSHLDGWVYRLLSPSPAIFSSFKGMVCILWIWFVSISSTRSKSHRIRQCSRQCRQCSNWLWRTQTVRH